MSTVTELPTGTWQIDPAATTVTVTVKKFGGLMTVPATLEVTAGTISVDEQHRVVDVAVSTDAASYRSKNSKRNEHVISKDFLDSDRYPTITFETDSVAERGDGYQTTGTVTVKGNRTPVEVTIDSVAVGVDTATFTATTTVDRLALGVDKMPAFVIGKDLVIEVAATAQRST
jgi:polyisoprenoid-binding protein YceI